jgi:nitrate/TMAO reductase-like tetraheme cytochrome c subunit
MRFRWVRQLGPILALITLAWPAAAQTPRGRAVQTPSDVVQCIKCHGNRDFLTGKTNTAGPDSALFVPANALEGSVHASLRCADCHKGFDQGYPHQVSQIVVPCQTCHETEGKDWDASIHEVNAVTRGDAPTCVTCHGSHQVLATTDPRSPTYKLNVAGLCGRCHADQKIIGTYFGAPQDEQARIAAIAYPKSVHGLALTRDGLVVSASCPDCHRAHKILPAKSPESSVNRANIPATCGKCHAGVVAVFDSSAHGDDYTGTLSHVASGKRPVCIDCHSAHEIVRANQPAWLVGTVAKCGNCHKQQYESYLDTYHGQVTQLGFGLAAKCSDCHTAHDMRPASDPRSSVFVTNLVHTCQQCHPDANANFTKFYPHPEPTERTKYPALYWPYLFMTILLVSVMAFFLLHTVLWFGRETVERRRAAHARRDAGEGGR